MAQYDLKIPKPDYKALIFDLDGTLVDSMPAHFKAWCKALEDQGQSGVFPEDVFYAMGGRPTRDIVEVINGEQGLRLDADQVASSKKRHYLKNLSLVELIPAGRKDCRGKPGEGPLSRSEWEFPGSCGKDSSGSWDF
jgi:phosphoglycolate phosphatase-like HAD superfamily hydrolase